MRYALPVILFFLFHSCISAVAQRNIFTTYSVNDGLVHNAVRCIYQDSKGFMWIGTWEGLSKYDGHKFTNYTTVNGLSHGLVNTIFETADGSIYIACNDGSLDVVRNNQSPEGVPGNKIIINRFQKLGNNKVIAATDKNGLYEFKDGKLVKPPQARPHDNYYDINIVNDSLFIAQSDSSLQLLGRQYELFGIWSEKFPVFAESRILHDSKGRIWFGTAAGLRQLSPVQERNKPFHLLDMHSYFDFPLIRDQRIRDILEDVDGNLWVGTSVGLVKISPGGRRQVITDKTGLPAADVTCLFQDREKNIWIGTSRGVVKLVTGTNISFYTAEDGLSSNNLALLLPLADGNFIVHTDKGRQLYDRVNDKFIADESTGELASGFSNNDVSLAKNKSGQFYIIFSPGKTGKLHFGPVSSFLGNPYSFKDRFGNYFFEGPSSLLVSRDLEDWQSVFIENDTRALLIDVKGDLWVGTHDSGLFRIRYEYADRRFRVIDKMKLLPGIGIRSLYEDSKGNIWAGTRYHGVFQVQALTNTPVIRHFDIAGGLTSNRIVSIAEDASGAIWLNFYQGLDKLVPVNDSFRVFNFSRFNNFFTNIQAMVFDNRHSLWLATTQGLVNITDGQMEKSGPLQTYITTATLGDSVYKSEPGKKITLDYKHKQLHFEFAAPGFVNEKQVMYSYRLLGSRNVDWSQPSNEYSVSYANLGAGSYQFQVRTMGWNGQWGEPAVFSFGIKPPFWQTAWFISAAALLFAAIIYYVVTRRIKTIRRESELKQKIAETEMMALKAQMNPHFIFNCISAIDNLIQTNQKDKATTYLTRFAKLIRAVLDSANNNLVPFYKDYESLQLFLQLEQFRCNNGFGYELTVDPEILNSDIRVPPLIAQPFAENAIHHGLNNKLERDRRLKINVILEKDYLKYTITDNGIGREKAGQLKAINKPEHVSYGIEISKRRVELHNHNGLHPAVVITDLKDGDIPAGTKVELWLSVK